VRALERDVSFLSNYLTPELVERLDLYIYKKIGLEWMVVEKEGKKVKEALIRQLTNCGFP